MHHSTYYISTNELASLFRSRGIDCAKNSRELIAELRKLFQCVIPMKTLVLAACFAGYAVVPQNEGQTFMFCRVSQ